MSSDVHGDSTAAEFHLENIISWKSAGARHQPDRPLDSGQENISSGQEIFDFVQRTIDRIGEEDTYAGLEKRSEKRCYVSLPVTATPTNQKLQPVGNSFNAITRDISSQGITMFSTRTVDSSCLVLELRDPDGPKLKAVMEVLRCRPIGRFYEITGEFVTKMYTSADASTRQTRRENEEGAAPLPLRHVKTVKGEIRGKETTLLYLVGAIVTNAILLVIAAYLAINWG